MKSRFAVVAIVFTLLLSGSVLAADKPQIDLPIYPGGESTMEINLTSEDLLPTLQAMLPMVGGKIAQKIDFNDVAAALKDVKRVEFLQLDIAKPGSDAEVAEYYGKKLPAGEWTRVFWQKAAKMGTVALYVQNGGEKLYGFRVAQNKVDGKMIRQVAILKTEGKIDFAKILAIAGKYFM